MANLRMNKKEAREKNNRVNTYSNKEKRDKGGILFTVLAFATAITVMAVVFFGTFFLIMRNNINGLGERYRDSLKNVPVLRLALPEAPDPEDPRYMSESELRDKYNEYRELNKNLKEQLNNAEKTIAELQKYKDREDSMIKEIQQLKSQLEEEKAKLENERKQLEEDRNRFSEMVAGEDKQGFREFFEKTYGETAQKIYADIIKEEKISREVKEFVQKYEVMDSSDAAAILEELSKSNMDLVVEILKNMKRDASAAIMAEMSPSVAAQVTEKLSREYLPNDTQNDTQNDAQGDSQNNT